MQYVCMMAYTWSMCASITMDLADGIYINSLKTHTIALRHTPTPLSIRLAGSIV